MTIDYICSLVAKLIKKYGETDPFRLAQAMRLTVLFEAMGKQPDACKGFFLYQSRVKVIVINSDLPEAIQRIILAHELGHCVLHKEAARLSAFHDFALYDSSSQYEYEANLFTAELLLEDELVFEALNEDNFFFAAARSMNVPAELLDFKFRILKNKGYKIVDTPILANSNFLKRL
ncbi:MAG: ImmA/IrrE family metallo-endopeptidase [Bacillota bacterium]|jgi:Zn-dependent peptidase ImmA (M78 family)